jgi:phage terminase large subunit
VAQLQAEYGDGVVYCDPAEPDSIETFRREGLDAVAADNDVRPGIKAVADTSDTLRVHEYAQNLINEFGQYQYRDGGDSDKPRKENDHAMDALRYVIHTAEVGGNIPTGRATFSESERDTSPGQTVGDILPDPTR